MNHWVGFEVAEEAVLAVRAMAERLETPVPGFGLHLPRTPSGRVELANSARDPIFGSGDVRVLYSRLRPPQFTGAFRLVKLPTVWATHFP